MGNYKIKRVFKSFLNRGLCPKDIAMTIAFAGVLGIFPLYGMTTFLMITVAVRLRLNTPLMVSTGYLFTPLLFVLWIPFIRIGALITDAQQLKISWVELELMLQSDWLTLLEKFSTSILLGILGWFVVAPFIFLLLLSFSAGLLKVINLYNKGRLFSSK